MEQPEGINILPGMTAKVTAVFESGSLTENISASIQVPAVAVVASDTGGAMVWVVDASDMTVHKRDVELGEVTGKDAIYITRGLSVGDRVAVAGVHKLREGMKVRLMDQEREGRSE
jgi:multidrug efflux pump subunit AcrA (membrane-fusion protein)